MSILRSHKFSLQNALNKVFAALGKLRLTPTNSALCQDSQKIEPALFVHLDQATRDDFYKLYGQDGEVLTWRGNRVLAYDGTDLNLPNTAELHQVFSVQRNQPGSEKVQALAGVLYDVRNDIALGAQLGRLQAEKNFLLGEIWDATAIRRANSNRSTLLRPHQNIFEVERFSGFSETAIKQDFFGVIFLATLESILAKGPQSELAERDRRRWNDTQARVNRAVSYVSLVDRAVQLLADPRSDPAEVLEDLHFLFKKDPPRNSRGRKFERKKFNHAATLHFQRYKKRINA